MIRNRTIAFSLVLLALFVMASCAIAPHPNEKIIIGRWKPVNVEKVVDSSALQAAMSNPSDSVRNDPKPGKTAPAGKADGKGNVSGSKKEATLDRLAQSEMRATLEIFANKTAVKTYPGNTLHATWKMKGKGTRLIAKNTANKMKFVIEILKIEEGQVIVIEHAPVGDLRITYIRDK